ncbi:glutathione S-transferase family protein [Henriciella aquimarina]|uniref:glutathione S-transferase family protein n=1 Tax=Henriciella aquimarina TaxID=545261 RepID=UPI000A004289|nr:glutathione S-transferase family protein [Henriciella aquimarina]
MELYGMPHWGSDIVEYQLALYGIDYDFIPTGDLFDDVGAEDALRQVNPLRQIPTLILDDGTVMTESAAITLLLADLTGRDDLVPPAGAPERAHFLRWLIFIVANIYPTYTYVDLPSRFVPVEGAQESFVHAVHGYAHRLYGDLESAAEGPWFLGERYSALDIYVAVITRWTPRRAWHLENSPALTKIAEAVERLPVLSDLVARPG